MRLWCSLRKKISNHPKNMLNRMYCVEHFAIYMHFLTVRGTPLKIISQMHQFVRFGVTPVKINV